MRSVLYDAVTLRHFASVSRMDILEDCHGHRPEPRWTRTVQKEIKSAANQGVQHCAAILQETWLGQPAIPTKAETRVIFRLRSSIGLQSGLMESKDPPYAHLGEAQSIFFAEKHQGQFATDDNAAYEFALQRPLLGTENVIDSIDILREAVAMSKTTDVEADQIANDIEATGRHLRRIHPRQRGPDYFYYSITSND